MKVFLAEFMDQEWLPASLHATLRDVLGFHLRLTLGYYYKWAADRTLDRAARFGIHDVAELGAGSAGFSETLAKAVQARSAPIRVEVSDLRPQPERYRELQREFPAIIRTHMESHDFLAARPPSDDVMIVWSAAFHHIPFDVRRDVLKAMAHRRAIIFESVTRNVASMLGCAIGFLPAMATPLYFLGTRSGRWRRFFWCWVIPVAPLMVAWDGVVSCFRCWTEDEWRKELAAVGVAPSTVTTERRRFSHMIGW